jgi:orotate phosphoribosyltransferase
MAYVRGKAKAHGLGNQIEGGIDKGEQTVVIEDLISTGGSALGVIDALEFVGVDVTALLSIFTYGFTQANDAFAQKGIPVYSLTDYATLIDVAVQKGVVSSEDLETLEEWRLSPETWPS